MSTVWYQAIHCARAMWHTIWMVEIVDHYEGLNGILKWYAQVRAEASCDLSHVTCSTRETHAGECAAIVLLEEPTERSNCTQFQVRQSRLLCLYQEPSMLDTMSGFFSFKCFSIFQASKWALFYHLFHQNLHFFNIDGCMRYLSIAGT